MSAEEVNTENIKEDVGKSILISPEANDVAFKQEKMVLGNNAIYNSVNEEKTFFSRRKIKKVQTDIEVRINLYREKLENEITDLKSVNRTSTRASELLPEQYHVVVKKGAKPIDFLKYDLRRECSPNTMNWNVLHQIEFQENITMIKAIPNTYLVAIAEEKLHLYSTKTKGVVVSFGQNYIPKSAIVCGCSTTERKLIVGSMDGDIFVYDYYDYKLIQTFQRVVPGKIKALDAIETVNYQAGGIQKCFIFILQQNNSVVVFDLSAGTLITDPKLNDLNQVRQMVLNPQTNVLAAYCETKSPKIALVHFNGYYFECINVTVEGTYAKEQHKEEDCTIYWEENKINLVNSQLISTYTEKGLEKNSKLLAVGRVAENVKFVACHPDLIIAKDDKHYLWISEDSYQYMLVSKLQRAQDFGSIKESPFAKIPVKGEFVERVNAELVAISHHRTFTVLDAAIHYLDQIKHAKLSTSLILDQYITIASKKEFFITDIRSRDVIKKISLQQEDLDAEAKGIIVTPDMKRIFMIYEYGVLKEYLLTGSEEPRVFALAEDRISHVSFSQDRQAMVFVREDCMVRLFDFNKFCEMTSETELILEKISAVAVSKEYFIVGTKEGGLRKYNFKKELQHLYRARDSMIKQLAIDYSGERIIACYSDIKLLHIFNAEDGREDIEIPTKAKVEIVCLPHKKKEYIACALENLMIQVFDFKGRELYYITLRNNLAHIFGVRVANMGFSMNCDQIVIQLSNGAMGVFKIDNEESVRELVVCSDEKGQINHLLVDDDEKYIICTLDNLQVQIYNFKTLEKIAEYTHSGNVIKNASVISSHGLVITASPEVVSVYSILDRTFKYHQTVPSGVEILTTKFSVEKDLIFIGYLVNATPEHDTSYKKSINSDIFHLQGFRSAHDGYDVYNFKPTSNVKHGILTPDEKKIILGMRNGGVHIYDYRTYSKLRSLKRLDIQPIANINVTADSKYLIVGSSNRTIKIIDLETYQERYEYTAYREENCKIRGKLFIISQRCNILCVRSK